KAPVVPAGASLRELCYDAFAILHNGDTRTPVFVAQRLNRQMLQQAGSVQRSDRCAPERIGRGGVAVPRYLYKVVYDAQTGRSWVHWQENSAQASAGAPISYGEFERRTGLRLVPVQ